ncbi:MAG: ArsR/SmtB family transcription factor [Desulfotignum sp.]
MNTLLSMTKALADGGRLRIIGALFRFDALCVCEIVELLGLSAPTVSRHMGILQNAGLVQSRKEGRWVFYRLAETFPDSLRIWLEESLSDSAVPEKDQRILENIIHSDRGRLCRQEKQIRAGELG